MAARAQIATAPRDSRIKYSDVMCQLSRAKAALWLLRELRQGELASADDDVAGWNEGMCLDELSNALQEAEAAFVKQWTPPAPEGAA